MSREKIISLKWKIAIPLVLLFFIMAGAIIFLSAYQIREAMFRVNEQQANNILYLVNLNINGQYKNFLVHKITTILETKKVMRFINNRLSYWLRKNRRNPSSAIEAFLKEYRVLFNYNIFALVLHRGKLLINSNPKVKFKELLKLQDIKGRNLKDIFQNTTDLEKGDFIIFNYNKRSIVGFLKLHGPYLVGVFLDIEQIKQNLSKNKQKMVDILCSSLKKIKIFSSGYAFIIDRRTGKTIFAKDPHFDNILKASLLSKIKSLPFGIPQHFRLMSHSTTYYVKTKYFRPLHWYVGVVVPLKEIVGPGYRLVKLQAAIVFIIFALSLVVILLLIMGAMQPLRRLTAFTSALAHHDFSKEDLDVSSYLAPEDKKRRDEIGLLTRAFLKMYSDLINNVRTLLRVTASQERMESELRIAKEIQMGILPPSEPQLKIPLIAVNAYLKPAREVGGDLYHYFLIDNDHLCFAVGDVSDKSVPAAFFMAMTMTLLKNSALPHRKAGDIIAKINNELAANNPNNMFVTLFMGILNIHTGELQYVNAGHNPVILCRKGKELSLLRDLSGPVVGAFEDLEYKTYHMVLEPGDTLFLYTDGVTEAMDEEKNLYGEERLISLMEKICVSSSPKEIIRIVNEDLKSFVGGAPQSDDITMMVIRRL